MEPPVCLAECLDACAVQAFLSFPGEVLQSTVRITKGTERHMCTTFIATKHGRVLPVIRRLDLSLLHSACLQLYLLRLEHGTISKSSGYTVLTHILYCHICIHVCIHTYCTMRSLCSPVTCIYCNSYIIQITINTGCKFPIRYRLPVLSLISAFSVFMTENLDVASGRREKRVASGLTSSMSKLRPFTCLHGKD